MGAPMKKTLLAAAFALSAMGAGSVANAATINSNGSTTLISGLTVGAEYFLTVSGTVQMTSTGRLADADFFQRDVGSSSWFDTTIGGFDVGVYVDGSAVNWGAFNPLHTYQIIYTATSESVSLFFRDAFYGDNSGFMTADVTAVPLPASALGLLAGLAGLGFLRRRKSA